MIKQAWKVTMENQPEEAYESMEAAAPESEEHIVEYSYAKLSGKTTLTVDGESFTVKGKPFGIGVARTELVLVGSSRGILSIDKSGRAVLSVDDANVEGT